MADEPSSLISSIVDADKLASGRVSVTANFLQAEQVNALRADANALYRAGVFVKGGLRRRCHNKKKGTASVDVKTATDEGTRLCEVCGLFDDAEKAGETVGDRDARDYLLDIMSELREMLQKELGIELLESMELQYLRYPGCSSSEGGKKKGFYQRHFDHTGDDDKPYRRKVSLLLYLNEDGWNSRTDGGILRAYVRPNRKSGDTSDSVQDIVPEGGKLVLFDSASVEHEVLPTCKERWAVVGWFVVDKDKNTETKAVGGRRKNRSRSSGKNNTNFPKKKRRKGRQGNG